jgi:hypothetical protein
MTWPTIRGVLLRLHAAGRRTGPRHRIRADHAQSVSSTNVFVHVEATRAAAGLGLLPCFMADRHDDLIRFCRGGLGAVDLWLVARAETLRRRRWPPSSRPSRPGADAPRHPARPRRIPLIACGSRHRVAEVAACPSYDRQRPGRHRPRLLPALAGGRPARGRRPAARVR